MSLQNNYAIYLAPQLMNTIDIYIYILLYDTLMQYFTTHQAIVT